MDAHLRALAYTQLVLNPQSKRGEAGRYSIKKDRLRLFNPSGIQCSRIMPAGFTLGLFCGVLLSDDQTAGINSKIFSVDIRSGLQWLAATHIGHQPDFFKATFASISVIAGGDGLCKGSALKFLTKW
jgi:hypothetical protein